MPDCILGRTLLTVPLWLGATMPLACDRGDDTRDAAGEAEVAASDEDKADAPAKGAGDRSRTSNAAPGSGSAAKANEAEVDPQALAALGDASSLAPTEQREGKFVFKHLPAKQDKYKPYEALFDHGRLPSLIGVLEIIKLPRSVPIVTLECGVANAFYTQQHHAVVLCYELADDFYTKFRKIGSSDELASNQTLNALTFVLLHEMGHGVVSELELGVTGGEEDTVDDLAALLLVDAKQPRWAIDGALSMAMLDAGGKPPYFDEHSIGEQRFYNITCIVFGSDPGAYTELVEKKILPERRAARCGKEYAQKNKAWETLLADHIRRK